MRFPPRFAFALVTLFSLPPLAASAGPIQWGYRAEGPGGIVLAEMTGLTGAVWSDFFLPNPRQFGTPQPDPNPGNGFTSVIFRSQATVILTDELSGDRATFPIFLDAIDQFEVRADGRIEPIFSGETGGPFWPDAGRFDLGGNVYRVRTPGGELLVNVEPGERPGAPVNTPEPASLLLAGIGLGAVLLRRRA
jgi:PEP-CTERM motif